MKTISQIFARNGIADAAGIPLSACRVTKPRLLEGLAFVPQSVYIGVVPYYAAEAAADPQRNVSLYAAAKDYHLYLSFLGEKIIAEAQKEFPEGHFALFGDHSPLDERHAAAVAGLGILGDNGLLITEKYSSFIFLFEILTDLAADTVPAVPKHCEGCGACRAACPAKGDKALCLSAVTQKKGQLSPAEEALLRRCGSAWGCDICSLVCPHTAAARAAGTLNTPLDFFHGNIITQICEKTVENDADFAERAYSWRKKETVLRNLRLLPNSEDKEHK